MHQRTIKHKFVKRIERAYQVPGSKIIASWLQDMYLQLGLSSEAARLPVGEQGLDSLERLRVCTDKNVDDICNVVRK